MARLERRAHHADVAGAVKGIVASAIRHLNQVLLDGLTAQLGRVDKVRGAELARPRLLLVVHVHDNDLAGLVLHTAQDHGEPDAPGAKDGYVGALFDLGRDGSRAVAGRDAAAKQTGAVHGGGRGDGNDGNVRDDGVLREGRRAHEVQQILSAGAEAGGAVGHDAAALGCADLAAEVGLAGLAELAFLALGGAIVLH